MNLKGRALTVQESIERMKKDGIKKIVVAYEDKGVGKCVLTYEYGRFTRLLMLDNNPHLIFVKEIPYTKGLVIINMIAKGVYKLNYCRFIKMPVSQHVSQIKNIVEKEVVLNV